jgi:hypothetical protein
VTDEGWVRQASTAWRLVAVAAAAAAAAAAAVAVAVADDDETTARYWSRTRFSSVMDVQRVEDLARGYAVRLGKPVASMLRDMRTVLEARSPIVLERVFPPSMNVVVPLAALQRPSCVWVPEAVVAVGSADRTLAAVVAVAVAAVVREAPMAFLVLTSVVALVGVPTER